jgi:RimJ/RimL family protein N-acetyltransferase
MDPWPLRHLVLRTPRLELRPDDDAGLRELVAEARHGVHAPEEMPFFSAWTDAPPAELGGNMMRFYWSTRAAFAVEDWTINFLVWSDGTVIGTQGLTARHFALTREVHTGSWVGLRHQGQGIGTEMRAAVLTFAFDHLGATQARSEAWVSNRRSRGVSRRLGYREDGTRSVVVRDQATTHVRLLLDRADFQRPDWKLDVSGADDCLPMLLGEQPG